MGARLAGVLVVAALASATIVTGVATASHVGPGPTGGVDVKVVADNNNLLSSSPATPGFDAQNDAQNETSVAISPANPGIVAVVANDVRMLQTSGFAWVGLYVSNDAGAHWFNTMPPGFPSDTSASGLSSGLSGLRASGDPVVRFDASGNLYLLALAFNLFSNSFDHGPDSVVYIAKYDYTPGTPGGESTVTSAANPPDFTYAFTTIVDRGSVTSPPGVVPSGFRPRGQFEDKPWLAVDASPSSVCFGHVYVGFTKALAAAGAVQLVLGRSTDGGATFSEPRPIAVRGQTGSVFTFAVSLDVAPDGTLYAVYRTGAYPPDPTFEVRAVRSDDCGHTFTKPVSVATVRGFGSPIVPRVGLLPQVAADDTDPHTVYAAFASRGGSGDGDVFVTRSSDRGATWGPVARVNDDASGRAQFFPTIAVSHGAVHVAWYDLRDSSPNQRILNVYYASSNTTGVPYPAFSHNVRVTDVGFDPDCNILLGPPAGPFIGDYIELDARYDGTNHIVHVAWADHRDISPCVPPFVPFPPVSQAEGVFNQNVYADRLVVAP